MKGFKLLLFFTVLFYSSNILLSQSELEHEGHDHNDEMIHNHHDHKNELAIAIAPVYFLNEEDVSLGLHLHYVRAIPNTKFGLGLAYEHVFDEHKHNNIGIVGSYRFFDPFLVSLAPGIGFEGSETEELFFSFHAEATYEFVLNDFHIGPALEVAYDPEDIHLSLGIHIGYGF